MMKKGLLIGWIVFMLSFTAWQIELPKLKVNRRVRYPVGVNFQLLGPTGMANASVDWFFTKNFNLEGGIGFQKRDIFYPAEFIGLKYHILGKTPISLTPYFGVDAVFYVEDGQFLNQNLYLMAGINKIKKNHLSWSLEVAYQADAFNPAKFWGGFSIGYRFGKTKVLKEDWWKLKKE